MANVSRDTRMHARDDLVVHSLLKTCLRLFLAGRQSVQRVKMRNTEAVLFVDRLPDAVRRRARIPRETLRIDSKVDVVTLGQVVKETEVRVSIITSRKVVQLCRMSALRFS